MMILILIVCCLLIVIGAILYPMRSTLSYGIKHKPRVMTCKNCFFKVKVPVGWKSVPGDLIKADLAFGDGHGRSISVIAKPLPKDISNITFNLFSTEDMSGIILDLFRSVECRFTNTEICDYGLTEIDKLRSLWLTYSFTYNRCAVKILNVVVFGSGLQYNITCAAQASSFDSYQSTFWNSVRSFKFLPKGRDLTNAG